MYAEAASIVSWLAPSSLFLFVNLVIGTIVISSRFFRPPKTQTHEHDSSSSLLDRVRSFKYYYHTHTQTESTRQARPPSLLERVKSFDFSLLHKHQPTQPESESENPNPQEPKPKLVQAPLLLQRLRSIKVLSLYRSVSVQREKEPEPEPELKRESGSEEEEEEDEGTVERRRPTTAPAGIERTWSREEEEVDANADDFIIRFKKQLRLQRVDSILRFREMSKANSQHYLD